MTTGSDAGCAISILYVDDDPELRRIVKICLELDDRLIVETVDCADKAVEALKAWQPDALLLDVSMPDIGGVELLALLRQQGASMPVLFLTGDTSPDTCDRLKAAGAAAVIAKPFDPLTLAATLGALLRHP